MKQRMAVGASVAVLFLAGGLVSAEGIQSGPQVGDEVVTPFHVLNINGPNANKMNCQV